MLAVFMSLALTVTAIAPAGVLAEETEQSKETIGVSVSLNEAVEAVETEETAEADEVFEADVEALSAENVPDAEFVETLSANNLVGVYITLDDKPFSGAQFYYSKETRDNNYKTLTEVQALGEDNDHRFVSFVESTAEPGVYTISKDYLSNDGYFVNGYYFLYEAAETQVYNDIVCYDNTPTRKEVKTGASGLCELKLYTISFEQGDHESPELPDPFITKAGKYDEPGIVESRPDGDIRLPESVLNYQVGYDNRHITSPGYALSYYEDQDNTKITNNYVVDQPLTLHPVFVNEQETAYRGDKNISDNVYYPWNYDGNNSAGDYENPPVVVTTAEGFITALLDQNTSFVIVKGNVMLTAQETKQIVDSIGDQYKKCSYNSETGVASFPGYKSSQPEESDFIIVQNGATLTFDSVCMSCGVNWEMLNMPITIQDGGSLILKNKAELRYASIAVQPQATINVDNSSLLDCDYLYNHGTITFADKADFDRTRDYSYRRRLSVHQVLFNAGCGKITGCFGEFYMDMQYGMWRLQNEYSESPSTMGDMRYVGFRNNGIMTFGDNAKLSIEGSSSAYQHDRGLQHPFLNNGTISLTTKESDNTIYNGSYAFAVRYASLVNEGEIRVTNRNGKYPCQGSTEYTSFSSRGGGIQVYEGEWINNGKFTLNNYGGLGMFVDRMFFDPEDCNNTQKSYDTAQRGRLVNGPFGQITVNNARSGVGIAFGQETECVNNGKITLSYAEDSTSAYNMPLVMTKNYYPEKTPIMTNNGSVVNNAYIGYGAADSFLWNGSKWTGTGREGLFLMKAEDDPVEDPVDKPQPGGNTSSDGKEKVEPAGGGSTSKADTPAPKGTSLEPASTSDPKAVYKVSSSDSKAPTVTYQKVADKKAKNVTVPATIKVGNVTYKVTAVADNAFKNSKATSITLSANITKIGKNAFRGSKAKVLKIKSKKLKLSSIGSGAFKGLKKNVVIKVPKNMKKKYQTWFRKKGLSKSIKLKNL